MKNGFTLIELMAVIALLGILSLIAIPAIDRSLNSSKEKLTAVQEKQIINGAKDYYTDNLDKLPKNNGDNKTIPISELKDEGYLPFDIKNPQTGRDYEGEVKVIKENNNYKYSVEINSSETGD